jgi:hypothetical protein
MARACGSSDDSDPENNSYVSVFMARSEGFEPPTPRFEVWCSIQLSYERTGVS